MAINFLNTVDLNKNQLNNAAIQNLATDPAAGVLGQVYYNTTDSVLKICITANIVGPPAVNAVWQGVSGDVASVTASTANNKKGINVVDSSGPDPIVGLDIINQANLGETAASGDELIIYDLSTTTNKSITVENLVGGYETTYTLPVSAGAVSPTAPTTGIITLTGSDSTTDAVTFSGTTGRVDVSGAGSTITIDLTDDVTIVDDLTVGGELTVSGTGQSSFGGQVTIPQTPVADTDAASKKFVLDQVAGLGSFQGGYDASSNPGSPALTGASNIAFGQGDFYAVTTAGTITFSDTPTGDAALEVGDFIFANSDIAADSNPASTDFTLILADQNIAGSGTTDGNTPKGVAGFDSANFNVSATGWVQLDSQKNPYGAKQSLNDGGSATPATSPCTRTETGGVTTFTIDLADASLFGTGTLAENVKVEVTDGSSPYQTVFAEVTRSGSASMAIAFTGSIADDAYQVLLSHV